MRVLITGSSGHFGEALARELTSLGVDHPRIDLVPRRRSPIESDPSPDSAAEAVKDIDFIVHAATLHKPHVATHSKTELRTPTSPGRSTRGGAEQPAMEASFSRARQARSATRSPPSPVSRCPNDEEVRPVLKNILPGQYIGRGSLPTVPPRPPIALLDFENVSLLPRRGRQPGVERCFRGHQHQGGGTPLPPVAEDVVPPICWRWKGPGKSGLASSSSARPRPFRPEHLRLRTRMRPPF